MTPSYSRTETALLVKSNVAETKENNKQNRPWRHKNSQAL